MKVKGGQRKEVYDPTDSIIYVKKEEGVTKCVKISGINMCFGIMIKHYDGFSIDEICAGHFNEPEYYNGNTNSLTKTGFEFLTDFIPIIKKWTRDSYDITIYHGKKTKDVLHNSDEQIQEILRGFFKNFGNPRFILLSSENTVVPPVCI